MAVRLFIVASLLLAGLCQGQDFMDENSLDTESEIAMLRRNLTAMWRKMSQLQSGGACAKPNVHIHVHGDNDAGHEGHDPHDPSQGHRNPDDAHVHLHLHVDDGIHHFEFNSSDEMEEDMRAHMGHVVTAGEFVEVEGPHPLGHGEMPPGGDWVGEHLSHDRDDNPHSHESHEYLDEVDGEYLYGCCHVKNNPAMPRPMKRGWSLAGCVRFRQHILGGPLEVKVDMSGFKRTRGNRDHGFHIHQLGDMSQGCNSLGGHYNPHSHSHRGPGDEERHLGDLGNIQSNQAGRVSTNLTASGIGLFGAHSVIGRSIVIHNGADDLGLGGTEGSRASGSAGVRVGCCIIGHATADNWNADMTMRGGRRHH